MKSEYELQAESFLKKHQITFYARFLRNGFMPWDYDKRRSRDIYNCVFERGGFFLNVEFGQSIAKSVPNRKAPTAYDVLACITKSNPGTFDEFCNEFGYNNDSIKDRELWRRVCKEFSDVEYFFSSEELNELQEIQ